MVPMVRVALVMVSGVAPVLIKVAVWMALVVATVCATNERVVGVRRETKPVPVKDIVTVPRPVLTTNVPDREPSAVGVNVTLIVQVALIATVPGQLLVCAKSPVVEMLLIVNGALLLFVSVTICGGVVKPTASG